MTTLLQIDETSGVQNTLVPGSITSNDIAIGGSVSLPPQFSTALAAVLPVGTGIPTVAALSGASSSNTTGTNILTFGANVTDVAFTLTGFDPLNPLAGVDSLLKTTDGTKIFLYVYSGDNNVVLAREGTAGGLGDPNGKIAFAAYLDTRLSATDTDTSDVGATGAKLWLVQFEPLQHSLVTNDPNDIVYLSGLLNVQVNNLANFSLEGAPSGQNLFLMFGDGTPAAGETAIVVTGKTPINQSSDPAAITSGDTVNTGQGGGTTTIGSNNQMIDPNEGMYFSFVKLNQASLNYTVSQTEPKLDQNEADVEANILFDSYVGAREAIFSVVQLQPPKGATLKITAINNTDTTEVGTGYIDGIREGFGGSDHQLASIDSVTISRTVTQGKTTVVQTGTFTTAGMTGNLTGVSVTFNDTDPTAGVKNTVTVAGVTANDVIDYHTVTDHNRVLIDNLGNSTNANLNAAFDIGKFHLTSGALTTNPLDALAFVDDAPTASIVRTTAFVTLDETLGTKTGDANAATDDISATNTDPFAAAYGTPIGALTGVDLVDTTTTTGVDTAGATTAVTLAITNGNGTDSGLKTTNGTEIDLWLEANGTVTGRTGGASGTVVLAIEIAGDGKVDVAQYAALKHPTFPSNYDEPVDLAGKLNAVVTVTDGDKDVATSSVDVGAAITFQDDGPALAFGNLVGTGTIDPQFGYWSKALGTDGLGANGLDIALTGAHLVKPDSTVVDLLPANFTFSETAPSPDGSGAYHFSGSLTGDLDNNPATAVTTEHFTLTAFANGTYALDLIEGFQSTSVTSTAGGSLGAGGPDPVQTLTLVGGAEKVVFFAVNPIAAQTGTTSIASAILAGAPDPTELFLQQNSSMADSDGISGNGNQPGNGTFPFINDTYAMNVSTSGIGVNNNVLQGNTTVGFQSDDESFVINPQSLLTGMKVFIDNSVGGYNTATEDLYYRTYYSDGTVSATTEVNTLTSEAGGQVSFTIQREGSKLIDAVQLLMGRGDVKIPVIQFITETNNLADGIKLDFTASIADGDGDTASSSFVANLSANELTGSFDFILAPTAAADAFNIDLPGPKNLYEVTAGFNVGIDKLVLLGANSYSIDNSGTNSIVDVTETAGGQHTIVTVVGVDLVAADIATII